MVTLVDTSPMKNLSFHFQAKIQLKSPPPKAKTNNNNMVDTSFLTWSDEKRRPPSSLVNIVKKNDIRKYFPIVKKRTTTTTTDNKSKMAITDKHKSNTITTIATYKPSIRSKYTRYTEIIPPRERRKIFNSSSSDDDDSSSSSEEDEEEERRRGRSRRSTSNRTNRNSKSRSRSPIFSGRRNIRRTRRRNNNTRSRGIMFCADELSNLIPPTTNQIKGLSEYKPIELKTFVSKTLIAQVERQVNATKKNKNKPTPHVQSIFEMKSLSLV